MKLTELLSSSRSLEAPAILSGLSVLSLILSKSSGRKDAIEAAIKSSLIINRTLAIPSQYMEEEFRSLVNTWMPKRRIFSKHQKLQDAFVFVDDEEWLDDPSLVEYSPGVSVSLPEFDNVCDHLGAYKGTLNPLGSGYFPTGHKFDEHRDPIEIIQGIDDLYGIKWYSSELQDSELRKFVLAIMAGSNVDINPFDISYLKKSGKVKLSGTDEQFRLVDPFMMLQSARKKVDIMLPRVGELEWSDIVELRDSPKTEEFRKFISDDDFLAKEPDEIIQERNEATLDAMGIYFPRGKGIGNIISKVFEMLPVPGTIVSPYSLYKSIKEYGAVANHYEKYPWFWTYYNCIPGKRE